MEEKSTLLQKLTPSAVLKAITPEAKRAIVTKCLGNEFVGIWTFPFRVGRESRFRKENNMFIVYEREKKPNEKPTNELYLIDAEHYLQISREHFQIEKEGEHYYLKDRSSTCGTMVNDQTIGKKRESDRIELKNGDIITIGSKHSSYKFEFIAF